MARKNIKGKHVDLTGSLRLAAFVFWAQMALWLLRGHLAASLGAFAMFILALCTSLFAAAVVWTVYVALEPYVRRRWPQTLIGWSAVLTGRIREAVVGRDVLIGIALGMALVAIDAIVDHSIPNSPPDMANAENLLGLRAGLAHVVSQVPSNIRIALIFLFLIYLLRALVRNQWVACGLFALIFGSLSLGQAPKDMIEGYVVSVLLALAMVRWGVLTSAVLIWSSNVLGNAPFTSHTSAWFLPQLILSVGAPLALAAWAFRTATAGQKLWQGDLLE